MYKYYLCIFIFSVIISIIAFLIIITLALANINEFIIAICTCLYIILIQYLAYSGKFDKILNRWK